MIKRQDAPPARRRCTMSGQLVEFGMNWNSAVAQSLKKNRAILIHTSEKEQTTKKRKAKPSEGGSLPPAAEYTREAGK
ncbi:unnamed protein product [Ixodes hexagonus]